MYTLANIKRKELPTVNHVTKESVQELVGMKQDSGFIVCPPNETQACTVLRALFIP